MVKFIILLLVLIWVSGFFLGKRRRVVRDVNHLLQIIVWVCLVFIGYTYLPQLPFLTGDSWIQLGVLLLWALGSYHISVFLIRRFFGPGKQ